MDLLDIATAVLALIAAVASLVFPLPRHDAADKDNPG